MLISGAGNKRDFAARVIGGTPSMEDIVQMVAELEYREEMELYQLQRRSEYPELGSQLDYIYHNGVDAWKTDIVDPVKAKYAKVEVDADELASRRATALAEYQLEEYSKAVERLSRYQLSVGRTEVTEDVVVSREWSEESIGRFDVDEMVDTVESRVVTLAIEPIDATVEQTTYDEEGVSTTTTIENPLITQDNAERAEAQSIVDTTPQSVIDTYNE